jgi:hypothetical protein
MNDPSQAHWEGRTPQQEWDEFWRDLVTDDNGDIDPEKVKNELYDFSFMMSQVSALYMELSGGAISKQNTYAFEVINQYRRRHGDEALAEVVHETDVEDTPAEVVARMFHSHYERLAPLWGYRTREASATEWDQVPLRNRELMVATAKAVIDELVGREDEPGRTVRIERGDHPIGYMSIDEFQSLGLLHEINRLILHPIGVALEIDGVDGFRYISGVWDGRDDPEGIWFGRDSLSPDKARQAAEVYAARGGPRLAALGWVVQPVGDEPQLAVKTIGGARST